jgi:hypothetical protein
VFRAIRARRLSGVSWPAVARRVWLYAYSTGVPSLCGTASNARYALPFLFLLLPLLPASLLASSLHPSPFSRSGGFDDALRTRVSTTHDARRTTHLRRTVGAVSVCSSSAVVSCRVLRVYGYTHGRRFVVTCACAFWDPGGGRILPFPAL